MSCWKEQQFSISENGGLLVILFLFVGKGKEEEEERERRDRKWKNVTGEGEIFGDRIHVPRSYQWTALKMHCSFLCLLGARSLAGNCSGDPTPCCSVAHYLFPTQWQHQESPLLIYQYCVCSQRLKQLGCFGDTPSCWWAQRLWRRASTGSVLWLMETRCYTTDPMDMPGSQCNVEQNRQMPSLLY